MKKTYNEQLKLIFESDVFRRMKGQEHHYNTTLQRHVISVARVCKRLSAILKKLGLRICEDELIIAAFCHDLGMVDRHDRAVYPTHRDLALGHGKRSIMYARSILEDSLTEREAHIIEHHMFPMKPPPKCAEGWVLIAADKFCTVRDFIVNIF